MYISLRGLRSTRRGSEQRLHFGLKRQRGSGALFLAGGVGRRQKSDDEQMRQQSLLVCLDGNSSLALLPWEKDAAAARPRLWDESNTKTNGAPG